MDMSSVFRTLFGREFGSGQVNYPESDRPALPTAMIGELKALDALRPGLGRAAIRFVETGTPTDLPDLIEAARKAAPRNPDYWQAEGARRDAEGACDLAMVTGAFPPGPELKRLLHVRVATGSVSRAYNASPTLENLLIDGFRFMVQGGLSRTKVKYSIAWDTVIPLKTLFAHLRQVGGTMADLFTLVLQQDDTKYLTPGSWALSADFADYAAVYPAALAEALRSIAPTFRAASVKLVEHHRATVAPEVEAVLVAMLTRPFDKQDGEIATSALARLPAAQLLALLGRDLAKADIDTRYGLVQAAGRQATADVVALLKARLPVEKAAKVRAAIEAVIAVDTHDAATTAKGAVPGEAAGSYPATDGSTVTIPPRLGTGAGTPAPAFDDLRPDFDRLVATIEEKMRAEHPEKVERAVARGHTPPNPPKPFASDIIEESFAALTGGEPPLHERRHLAVAIRSHPQGQAWIRTVLARMSTADAVQSVGSTYGIVQSIFGNDRVWGADQRFGVDVLRGWIDEGRIDLRDLGAADELRQLLARLSYSYDRESVFAPLQALPREAVWPWMAEQISVLDEAMGLRPSEKPIALDRAMEALTLLPAVPQRYAAKLLDIAVSEKRPLRRQAMALLRDATDLASRLEGLLDDKRQQVRINVASWLADLRAVGSESALRRRLKKEKSDPVRAALIMSLQRLGADLSDVIGPAVLIAEAEAAAAKGTADLPDWLNAAALPAMYFRDGAPVPPALIRHWLALAIRLKDPAASGQFGIYLDQLRPEDARALSDRLLDAWIGFDTQAATLEEATAHAAATYQQHWSWLYQPNKSPALRDEIMAEIVREKTGEIINSGSDTKGVLALACRADPAFAAVRVRWFLKKHGRRSNQAMALLEVLAAIGQPATLQVVIAASVRLKQKSTQARAAEIAQRYAEDRGWSIDELADRTVPTAGFDDDGGLDLPCGTDGRPYAARIDAGLAIHLFNPDGKPIKTLPAGDDEMTKESKKALSTAKKELGQVVELQRGRLFEAMCTERNWASDDWRLAFLDHPVMRRLAERLVWQGLDAEGRPGGLFRPTQEGDLTDALDAAVDLAAHPRVRLAHGALVDEATCRAWTAHLADYEITPFIAQFDTLRAPLTAGQGEADAIVDRLGWAADSLTYRGVVEKRGYERVMGDGGGCNEYVKSFPSHGLTATIWHTGSNAVDENNRVALKELRFARRGSGGPLRLSEVPPVMLAECWADYHAAAAKGVFDPAWEAISPW